MSKSKIKNKPSLKKALTRLKRNRKKIVFTNGCFDILHRGHVELLEKARRLGDILIVAINTDASVKKIKGPRRPVNNLSDRAKVLAALEVVDYVTWFPEPTPSKIIKALRPDVLVKGGDWKHSEIVGKTFLASYGGKVKTIPYVKGYSTTSILRLRPKRVK